MWVVHQDDAVLSGMDAWNTGTHGRSGLIDKVKASTLTDGAVEQQALAFLREHVPAKASPMCGNSICQDRRFLARWMPALENWFHYRNLDVSTLKELCRRWKPELMKGIPKEGQPRGARRRVRVDRGTQVLSRQFPAPMSARRASRRMNRERGRGRASREVSA